MASLREYAAKQIARGASYIEAGVLSDPLIAVFARLNEQKEELLTLKQATTKLIWFRHGAEFNQYGESIVEVVPFSASDFEQINNQIFTLESKISHNEIVLAELDIACQSLESYSLNALQLRRSQIVEQIEFTLRQPNLDFRDLLNSAQKLGDRSLAETRPELIKARQEAEARADVLRAELKALNIQVEKISVILSKFKG